MRIAMLAPISSRTPSRHYGPWEQVTSLLTEALVARGVDVTPFATKDSRTAAKLDAVCPAPYSVDPTVTPRCGANRIALGDQIIEAFRQQRRLVAIRPAAIRSAGEILADPDIELTPGL